MQLFTRIGTRETLPTSYEGWFFFHFSLFQQQGVGLGGGPVPAGVEARDRCSLLDRRGFKARLRWGKRRQEWPFVTSQIQYMSVHEPFCVSHIINASMYVCLLFVCRIEQFHFV